MNNEDFESLVMEALAKASASLLAADAEMIWMDTSGSGWTQSYDVIIKTKTPHRREVPLLDMSKYAQGVREPRTDGATAWVDDLPPGTKQAVSEALSGIDLGEQVMWEFRATNQIRSAGALVWPITARVAILQKQRAELSDEIRRLITLDKSK